jgi:hypothetical protein
LRAPKELSGLLNLGIAGGEEAEDELTPNPGWVPVFLRSHKSFNSSTFGDIVSAASSVINRFWNNAASD